MSTSTFNDYNRRLIEEFRANAGSVGGMFAGMPILLLTTTGARSGQTRVNPLAYSKDGDNHVVIASKGGAPTHPSWYHNLVAHPNVTVEVGNEKFEARARVTEGEERARLFAAQAAQMSNFNDYQEKTSRQLPVIVLERV